MNKWRQKHSDHGKAVEKSRPDDDSGSTDAELSEAAETVYDTAAQHREGVKARDAAAKARKKKGARRG
jgi:hypothetical protein